jgi:Methyltransferase domain
MFEVGGFAPCSGILAHLGQVGTYFAAVAAEWPQVSHRNLEFRLRNLFDGIRLQDARVLDLGAGDGLYSLYPVAAGAERLVALEPEAAGSGSGVRARFERATARLGTTAVDLRAETLQEYDSAGERFDVVISHSSINHLDEPACMALQHSEAARGVYRALLGKIASLTEPGGSLVVLDASRSNLFARLPVRHPLAPSIEWEKHQRPELWIDLLREAGFERPNLRWGSFSTLRTPGRVLLGNRLASWFLGLAFLLTMTRVPSERPASRPPYEAASEPVPEGERARSSR